LGQSAKKSATSPPPSFLLHPSVIVIANIRGRDKKDTATESGELLEHFFRLPTRLKLKDVRICASSLLVYFFALLCIYIYFAFGAFNCPESVSLTTDTWRNCSCASRIYACQIKVFAKFNRNEFRFDYFDKCNLPANWVAPLHHVTYAQYIKHTPRLIQAARSTKALRLAANKALESFYCLLWANKCPFAR